jgi:thiosulfate/3-mercaptopyruvate sulfurtransferase
VVPVTKAALGKGKLGSIGPPVIDADWLAGHRPEVVVADVRWYLDGRSGYDAYRRGHLPGAVFVDLDRCLAAPPSRAEGRHPLPDPHVFAKAMASLGISDGTRVIAYDDAGGVTAARLVWLLRVTGHAASLLDGGLGAWPGPLDTEIPHLPAGVFHVDGWPTDRLATADDVWSAGLVIDARAPARYRGEVEPVDRRAGHIPGARNAPTGDNLDEHQRFKSPEDLRSVYEALGTADDDPPVVYCGSGVTACHDLLALERAGFEQGRLYVGSWSQWSGDPARPVETGG